MSFIECIVEQANNGKLKGRDVSELTDAFEKSYEAGLKKGLSNEDALKRAENIVTRNMENRIKAKRDAVEQALKLKEVGSEIDNYKLPAGEAENHFMQILQYRIDSVKANVESRMNNIVDKIKPNFLNTSRDYTSFSRGFYQAIDGIFDSTDAGEIGRVIRATIDYLHERFKAAGGVVGDIEYYVPQGIHVKENIRNVPKGEWVDYLMQPGMLKREKMVDINTGDPLDDKTLRKALSAAYDSIVTDGRNKSLPAVSKGKLKPKKFGPNEMSKIENRFIHFNDSKAFKAYNDKFGVGEKGLAQLYLNHIDHVAKQIAIMERMGVNPSSTVKYLLDRIEAKHGGADDRSLIGRLKAKGRTKEEKQIRVNFREQLKRAQRDPIEADLLIAFYEAVGKKVGLSVKEMAEDFNLNISRVNKAANATNDRVFNQPNLPAKDRPAFYSKLTQLIEQKMGNSATPEQIRGIVKEAKVDEIEWSGLEKYISKRNKIDKADLLEFLEDNILDVYPVIRREGDELMPPIYGDITFPEGSNYREVLFVLPEEANKGRSFESTEHWDENNVLAFTRVNDRIDAQGKKVLFVEEIQSDWHQKGRKEGYIEEAPSFRVRLDDGSFTTRAYKTKEAAQKVAGELNREFPEIEYKVVESDPVTVGAVPPAPFRKNWHEFTLKRLIDMAVREGYDKVAWTTGEMQAKRYEASPNRGTIRRGMDGFYDKILVRTANKIGKKYGARVERSKVDLGEFSGSMADWEAGKGSVYSSVHSLPVTQRMRTKILNEGQELYQSQGRGRLRVGPNKEFNIELFKNADKSTFAHETGHYFLEVMSELSKRQDSPIEIKSDVQTILKWMGVESVDHIETKHHEKWARAFEVYLREGNAPTKKLKRVFKKFKDWLTQVYRSVQELDVEINDEIRGVMDRMLTQEPSSVNYKSHQNWVESQYNFIRGSGLSDPNSFGYRLYAGGANILRAAQLGTAGVSALTDVGYVRMTAKYNGLDSNRVLRNYVALLAGKKEYQAIVRRSGQVAEIVAGNAYADARYTGELMTTGGWTAWAAGFTNKMSGLARLTRSAKDAVTIEGYATLAEQLGSPWGRLPKDLRESLSSFNVNQKDWDQLRKLTGHEKVIGEKLVDSDLIVDNMKGLRILDTNQLRANGAELASKGFYEIELGGKRLRVNKISDIELRDKEHKGFVFKTKYLADHDEIRVDIMRDNKVVGGANFGKQLEGRVPDAPFLHPDGVELDLEYRHQGLMTEVYKFVEELTHNKIIASGVQSESGRQFHAKKGFGSKFGLPKNIDDEISELSTEELAEYVNKRKRPVEEVTSFDNIANKLDDWINMLRQVASNEGTLKVKTLSSGYYFGKGGNKAKMLANAGFMYRTFPISVVQNHLIPGWKRSRAGALKDVVLLSVLGGGVYQFKQILSGRTPQEITSEDYYFNPNFLVNALIQGGGLGLVGDVAFKDYTGYFDKFSDIAKGPMVGAIDEGVRMAWQIGKAGATLDDKEIAKAKKYSTNFLVRKIPFNNLWYSRLLVERTLFDTFKEMSDPKFEKSVKRTKKRLSEAGQDFWWAPGESVEDAEPDKILGEGR